jgi:hypothetical protein
MTSYETQEQDYRSPIENVPIAYTVETYRLAYRPRDIIYINIIIKNWFALTL